MSLEQDSGGQKSGKEKAGEGSTSAAAGTNSGALEDPLVPISEEALTDFSEDLLDCLLRVVPLVRDTVYRSCDLLVSLIKRNGPTWRDRAIAAVKEKVSINNN